ncbi:MAG: hypothetical protein AAGE99_04645, partial [Chlamydiota bacterium]
AFNPEEYLSTGKASLWLNSRMGSGGVGRSIEMGKIVGEGKDKRIEADVERQQRFNHVFARLKYELHLKKENPVYYDIARHSIVIYQPDGKIKGKYDLKDLGLNEGRDDVPIRGGGGLKQLVRDFASTGVDLKDEAIRELSDTLKDLNDQMKKLSEFETGGRLGYVSEVGNKGNVAGLSPFNCQGDQGSKVLHGKGDGFFIKTLKRLGLITTDKRRLKSDVHKFNERGKEAVEDIRRAIGVQRTIVETMNDKKRQLQSELKKLEEVLFNDNGREETTSGERKEKIDTLKKQIKDINRHQDELAGLNPAVSDKIRALNAKIKRLAPSRVAKNRADEKKIAKWTKEIKKLTSENRRPFGVNPTVLQFMLMELNREVSVSHERLNDKGELVRTVTTKPAKEFLKQIPPKSYADFGIKENDHHQAAVVRNALIKQVVEIVAADAEKTVTEENSGRKLCNGLRSKPLKIDPNNPSHKELQQISTNMGVLVYNVAAAITSSEPLDHQKATFIEGRPAAEFPAESRALEFLIAAVIFGEDANIGDFDRESETIRNVMQESLDKFKNQLSADAEPFVEYVDEQDLAGEVANYRASSDDVDNGVSSGDVNLRGGFIENVDEEFSADAEPFVDYVDEQDLAGEVANYRASSGDVNLRGGFIENVDEEFSADAKPFVDYVDEEFSADAKLSAVKKALIERWSKMQRLALDGSD